MHVILVNVSSLALPPSSAPFYKTHVYSSTPVRFRFRLHRHCLRFDVPVLAVGRHRRRRARVSANDGRLTVRGTNCVQHIKQLLD